MAKKILMIFLIMLFIFSSAFAQNYADININLEKDGTTSIKGTTNYEQLNDVTNSHKFTSKDGEYWIFNLTTNEQFDDYIFTLNLPKNSQINYVNVPGSFRIEENSGRISIVGFGENEPLSVIVQYKISYVSSLYSKDTLILILSGLIVFFIILSTILLLKVNDLKKRKEFTENQKEKTKRQDYDIDLFTPRQQEILKLLEDSNRITQKELEEIMNIPKSSVSRNIRTLEIKGIISKERVGQTNYIFLK